MSNDYDVHKLRHRRGRVSSISLIVLVALGVLGWALYYIRPSRIPYDRHVASMHHPAVSRSGKYELHVLKSAGDACSFAIRTENDGQSGAEVFRCAEEFRTLHTLFFLWDDEDRVWVYSGDVGTYFWVRNEEGVWEKKSYAAENVPAPTFLHKVRPGTFPR